MKFPLKCPAPSTTYLLVNIGDHPMTKTITGTLAASLLRPSRKYRGRALTHTACMWEVRTYVIGEGYVFLGHVEGTTHNHALTKARLRFPHEKGAFILQQEYQPS